MPTVQSAPGYRPLTEAASDLGVTTGDLYRELKGSGVSMLEVPIGKSLVRLVFGADFERWILRRVTYSCRTEASFESASAPCAEQLSQQADALAEFRRDIEVLQAQQDGRK